MTMTNALNDRGADDAVRTAPLLPPIAEGTSLAVARTLACCTCNADISRSKRTLDLQGRYHCPECWSKRVKAGTAIDLVPAGSARQQTPQQALLQAIARHGLVAADGPGSGDGPTAASNSIMVYVAPAPGTAAEKGKIAFYSGFYATAGIAAALAVIAFGALVFFVAQAEWRQHRAQIAAFLAGTKETPIQQEPAIPAISADGDLPPIAAVHLDAGVDSDSNFRVAAANDSAQTLTRVVVEVIPDGEAPMASLDIGALDAGQTKTVSVRVPGLSQLAGEGRAIHVRADNAAADSPNHDPGHGPLASRLQP
jgi:hypothetical protein